MADTAGIIGFGRIGRLAAALLKDDFKLAVYDPARTGPSVAGVSRGGLKVAASCDVVVFCVPISRLRAALVSAARHIRPGALALDVCSVKEYPLKLMKEILPGGTEIVGTHPLFGPSSFHVPAARRIVVCPGGTKRARAVAGYLEAKGLKVLPMAARRHDLQIAAALNVPHLIGRALRAAGLKEQAVSTLNYERLLEISRSANADSWQLFRDIRRFNRFSGGVEKRFFRSFNSLMRKNNNYGK